MKKSEVLSLTVTLQNRTSTLNTGLIPILEWGAHKHWRGGVATLGMDLLAWHAISLYRRNLSIWSYPKHDLIPDIEKKPAMSSRFFHSGMQSFA